MKQVTRDALALIAGIMLVTLAAVAYDRQQQAHEPAWAKAPVVNAYTCDCSRCAP